MLILRLDIYWLACSRAPCGFPRDAEKSSTCLKTLRLNCWGLEKYCQGGKRVGQWRAEIRPFLRLEFADYSDYFFGIKEIGIGRVDDQKYSFIYTYKYIPN